jgi:hypothetical protein
MATVRRWWLLHRSGWALGVGIACLAILVLEFVPLVGDHVRSLKKDHEMMVSFAEHLAAAVAAGCFAYWWLYGHKRQSALKSYREKLLGSEQKLVDWYGGRTPERHPNAAADHDPAASGPLRAFRDRNLQRARALGHVPGRRAPGAGEPRRLRQLACERLGEEIIRSPGPAVAIVKGRAGTGRTGFILELVDYLAGSGLLPIPVLARHGGEFDLEKQAKEKFFESAAGSRDEIDALWSYARQTRGIVVLVDGMDKELFEELEGDERKGARAIKDLQGSQVHLVLATTLDLDLEFNIESNLGLDRIPSLLREDLDRFTLREARDYLDRELEPPLRHDARKVLGVHDAHDDETLVDPFYLDLLIPLTRNGLLRNTRVTDRRAQSDEWRREVLKCYLGAVKTDRLADLCRRRLRYRDTSLSTTRGDQAYRAAKTVAALIRAERDLTVEKKKVKGVDPDALLDAEELNLLRVGHTRVSFTSDELGAYLFAENQSDAKHLLEIVAHVAEGQVLSLRHQRFALIALTFWLLEHAGPERFETFDAFLIVLERHPGVSPRLAAAALRVLNACRDLAPYEGRVAHIVRTSIERLLAVEPAGGPDSDPNGNVRLVRSLSRRARMRETSFPAHELLWMLARRRRNVEVEWPATRALASLPELPALEKACARALDRAESNGPADLSLEASPLGNDLASLAWVVPAFRPAHRSPDDPIEKQWIRLKKVCRKPDLSPLRGEMALAQGLKLAVLTKRRGDYEELRDLLLTDRLRFWHARLVLVQAMVAYGWLVDTHTQRCFDVLRTLHDAEDHPLTKRAIVLGMECLKPGLTGGEREASRLYEYVWSHEHDAVTWVEQRKWKLSQLAADVVLLSNMTYALWAIDRADAEQWACVNPMPRCITDSTKRIGIADPRSPNQCGCLLCGCTGSQAVRGTWARFTEAFCREQARLVERHGPPPWMEGPARQGERELSQFWQKEAERIYEWQVRSDAQGVDVRDGRFSRVLAPAALSARAGSQTATGVLAYSRDDAPAPHAGHS